MRRKDPEKMQELIDFIDSYYVAYHRTPSTREIAEGTSLQKSAVHNYLAALREEGRIDYDSRMIMTERINDQIMSYNQAGIVGAIPCGQMTLEQENIEDYVNLPMSIFGGGDLYILHTYGDSMTGAGIDDGDLVVVRKQTWAKDGDLVIAYVEGEGSTLKRYQDDKKNQRVILHPENEKYQDIIVTDCRIQGVVVNIIKQTSAGKRLPTQ